MPSFETGVLGH